MTGCDHLSPSCPEENARKSISRQRLRSSGDCAARGSSLSIWHWTHVAASVTDHPTLSSRRSLLTSSPASWTALKHCYWERLIDTIGMVDDCIEWKTEHDIEETNLIYLVLVHWLEIIQSGWKYSMKKFVRKYFLKNSNQSFHCRVVFVSGIESLCDEPQTDPHQRKIEHRWKLFFRIFCADRQTGKFSMVSTGTPLESKSSHVKSREDRSLFTGTFDFSATGAVFIGHLELLVASSFPGVEQSLRWFLTPSWRIVSNVYHRLGEAIVHRSRAAVDVCTYFIVSYWKKVGTICFGSLAKLLYTRCAGCRRGGKIRSEL